MVNYIDQDGRTYYAICESNTYDGIKIIEDNIVKQRL